MSEQDLIEAFSQIRREDLVEPWLSIYDLLIDSGFDMRGGDVSE